MDAKQLVEFVADLRLDVPGSKLALLVAVEGFESAEIIRLRAEVERLTAVVKAANAQAEHFERQWYLRGDEVKALRADAEKKDALLVRAHDMLDYIGCSPEGASKDIRMAKELQRDIDAMRAAQGLTNPK